MTSLGLTATLALSPLSWVHYYMLLLIPAWWLMSLEGTSKSAALLGLIALVMSSGAPDHLLIQLQGESVLPLARALSWIPAWIGILLIIRTRPFAASLSRAT